MKLKLFYSFQRLCNSHWFLPTILSICALVLLINCIYIDHVLIDGHILTDSFILLMDPLEIQKLMTVIISTSIAITCVTLSITMLTLAFTSNQLGPRLLPNFIRQGKTQSIVGIFLSIYIYCLILLALTSSNYVLNEQIFVTLYVGLALAILSFVMLIYFINHIIKSIQIHNIIENLGQEIKKTLNRQFTNATKNNFPKNISIQHEKNTYSHICQISSGKHGYIQAINYDKLRDIANSNKILIEVLKRPGNYIHPTTNVINIYYHQKFNQLLIKQIQALLIIGNQRTNVQDVEYGFDQIAEIAVRALSPGINNPYTAINCIHQIGHLLHHLSSLKIPPNFYLNKTYEKISLIFYQYSYDGIIKISLQQLRQSCENHITPIIELLKMINELACLDLPQEMEKSLRNQAKIIFENATTQKSFHQSDFDSIEKVYRN